MIYDVTSPFRLQLITDLTEKLCDKRNLVPSLVYSLVVLRKRQDFNIIQFSYFIEFLKIKNILSNSDIEILLNVISTPSCNENYKRFISNNNKSAKSFEEPELKIYNEEEEEEYESVSESSDYEETGNSDEENCYDIEYDEEEEEEEECEFMEDEIAAHAKEALEKVKNEAVNLTKGFKGNRYSIEMKKFSTMLYFSSKFSYNLIRNLFCFPCDKTVRKFSKPFLNEINCCLFNKEMIGKLLEIQNIHYEAPTQCTIGVDAAVFSAMKGVDIIKKFEFLKGIVDEQKIYNSIFTFYIEPLEAKLRSFPIHIVLKEDGFADSSIDEVRNALIEIVNNFNMKIVFKSTDGDRFFNEDHEHAFSLYSDILESGGSIDDIIEVVKKFITENAWPISDLLHILKNIRVYSLFKNIGLSLLSKYDPSELENFLEYKNCLKDKSSQGSMKDSYPLFLFGFESFMKSVDFNQSHFLICPFFLIIEAVRNVRLNLQTRKSYLRSAFYFVNYFLHQVGYIKTIDSRIGLIRLMNTILGFLVCFENGNQSFNLAHIGTHPIECFFGMVRIGCHFQHTLLNVLKTISRTILTNNFLDEFNIKKKIDGRINVAGASIEHREDEYGFFPFHPEEFFVLFLKRLYGFNIEDDDMKKIDSWYQYLSEHHLKTDDCDMYQQNPLSGCNISSRNITFSPKN